MVNKSVSGVFVTVGGSIIVASIYALKPPQQYYFAGLGSFFGILVPLILGVWNYAHRYKPDPFVGVAHNPGYINQVQQTPPTLNNIKSRLTGNRWLGFALGFQYLVSFDRLSAEVTLTDLETNKTRMQTFRIPDLGPGESNPLRLLIPAGRKRRRARKAEAVIFRDGVEVVRVHSVYPI